MKLVLPQALLLLLPLALLVWKTGRVPGPPMWLRFALVGLGVFALAQPELVWKSAGSDLVVVVDRSRSMPPGSEAAADELLRLVEAQRGPGDRLGVVGFGREARLELPLSATFAFGGFTHDVDPEASNLAAALDAAAEVVPPERAARVLVLSDGRATGADARAAARRLAARGLPVDYRWLGREDSGLDVAVVGFDAPAAVATKEPFQLSATVHATAPAKATVTLWRNGHPLAKGAALLHPGDQRLSFQDLVDSPGLASYELSVDAAGDGVVENDVGRTVLRVVGPPRVLLVTESAGGTLARTLAEAGLALDVRSPFALTLDALDGVGAVVLENVEASSLSERGLSSLAAFVEEAGGGLVMTGGRKSFGEGGYRKSPVEPLLPVSLEVREEQRKAAVAMSIVMDCSCSMGATVPDGRTKMELAAEGVVGALELLDDRDEASVDMVDTVAHEVFGLSAVSDGLPLGKVARGFSGGGGIYIGEGLRAGKRQILKSDKPTRHVLLFADAADSEQPDDYQRTLSQLAEAHVTVSVIGMGKRSDSDADLLVDVAHRGGGRLYFAEDVTSLPRIFSQETLAVARASFVDTPTAVKVAPDLGLLGKLELGAGASAGGYNLAYARSQASIALRTADDNAAPFVSLWQRGAGRVAAFAGEVDGSYTGGMRGLSGYRPLLEQMVRWAIPAEGPVPDAVARATRQGSDVHVTLDFDRANPPPEGSATLVLLRGDGAGSPVELPMRWEDEDRLGAHYTLPGTGTFHPVVKLGQRVFRAPPVTLPYAPELEPGSAAEGKALLAELARATSGVERLSVAGLFRGAAKSAAPVPLAPLLVVLALGCLLAEVATRRFLSGNRRKPRAAGTPARGATATHPTPRAHPGLPVPTASSVPPGQPEHGVGRALDQAQERAGKRLRR